MNSRRRFLKDAASAAGVVFTSCSLLDQPLRAQAKRRQVMVGGRRIRTIDIHAHVVIPEATALMGIKTAPDNATVMAPVRFDRMDEWGTDMQALSINPTWYAIERDVATRVIKVQNEKLAELCARYPDRFVAFASVALQFPDLAAEQLEEGVKKYNLRGAAIGGHVNGDELSAPKFDPFWRKAEELGVLVFMHPQGIPEMSKRFAGNGGLDNVIGNPLETTIFLSHLIFDGTLDRFPGLKICAAHAGGYLPSYIGRSDYACVRFPESCRAAKKKASEYIRQLYFDSMVFTPEGLRHLVAECGAGQIMIGTDYPYPWSTTTVDHVLKTPGLSDADKRAILGENAARLLKIQA
ncbi:MAG TPA: amidohydrolase family protein [Bryobacteraceae bacterium]|jgi:aminocarboxymuconate-semialdehyde decarboxylase|nr:amidohydrolase family protein [Bryobacteraceae bacterium]